MLNHNILEPLITPFGAAPHELEFLRNNQNYVYAFGEGWKRRILRISTQRHRKRSEIEAELNWISFLADRGVPACRSVPSLEGRLSVEYEHGGQSYVCTCFERASGGPVPKPADNAIYLELGRIVGRMHRAAREANLQGLQFDRPLWQDSRLLREDLATVKKALAPAFEAAVKVLIDQAGFFAKNPDAFGLIHGDVHFGNCFLHEATLSIFDFDNCEYGYFLHDLAILLYDAIYCRELHGFADPGLNARVRDRWYAVMEGYAETGVLTCIRSNELKTFFLLREAVIFIHYHRTLDVKTCDDAFQQGLEVMNSNVVGLVHQLDFDSLAWSKEPS